MVPTTVVRDSPVWPAVPGVPVLVSVRVVGPADPDFAKAAADAVYEWRFTPTYLDGVAVEVEMKVTATFRAE